MANRGRPPVLDAMKRREILAILSVGCSRRIAARYVGCDAATIRNTAERDPAFAEQIQRAENGSQFAFMKNIQNAAKKEQYWRAAAWALERINPEDFAPRSPEAVTLEQAINLMTQLSEIIVAEVPVAKYRKPILRRVEELIESLRATIVRKTSDVQPSDPTV